MRGVFIAYLAGYKTVEIVPQVIDEIYTAFKLKGKKLKGYPGFKQRQATANRVQKLTKELIQIFEAGNHLMAIGEYELAGACYEHVEQFYNGKELYNNIGVCYTLLSLDFSENYYDPFLYPIEISWNTRINKPKNDRGNQNLSAAEKALRIEYLTKAETSFLIASKMDAHYIAPEINLMCAMVMKDAAAEAVEYYMQNQLLKKSKLIADNDTAKEKIRLAFSLALYASGKEEQARRIWMDLTTMSHGLIAQQANNNLMISVGGEIPMSITHGNTSCTPELSAQNKMIDGVRLHRFSQSSFQSLAKTTVLELAITNQLNSIVYTFKKSGKVAFVLQRVLQPTTLNLSTFLENGGNGFLTNQGYIAVCKNERLSFVVNDYNRVLEWGKYYVP